MNLQFDTKTLTDWQTRGVRDILVRFVERGCEGTEIEIAEEFDREGLKRLNIGNIWIWTSPEHAQRLETAKIVNANGKWFFHSQEVQSRCGCGKSFSFEDPVSGFLRSTEKTLSEHAKEGIGILSLPFEVNTLALSSGTYFINPDRDLDIVIEPGAEVTLYELIAARNEKDEMKVSATVKEWAKLYRRTLMIGIPDREISYVATSTARASATVVEMELLSLGLSGSKVRMDGIGIVPEGLEKVKVQVHESQIFLSDTASFRGIPSLKIASNEVEASHSLTVERLSVQDQAFLTSRGLSEEQAQSLILQAKIAELYKQFPELAIRQINDFVLRFTHPKATKHHHHQHS